MAAEHEQADGPSTTMPVGATAPPPRVESREGRRSLADLPAVEIADLLLLGTLRWRAAALVLEPQVERYDIILEQGAGSLIGASLPCSLGDAVAARLAILANIDITAPGEQSGRLRVASRQCEAEFLVSLQSRPRGLMIELRRIADRHERRPGAKASLDLPAVVGDYRLLTKLGRGGTGTVYRAEHQVLGKAVAVKVLDTPAARDPEINARLMREARAASRVRHPGVVNMLDFCWLEDGRACVVMELVEGTPLDEILRAEGALPPWRAVRIARNIAAVVAAAHDCGVAHRDLKPGNVFLEGREDRIKIVDFGAALMLGAWQGIAAGTDEHVIVGTPRYMSPEHFQGLPTDQRSDVYSLGCMLYQMLAGRPPYEGAKVAELARAHLCAPVPAVFSDTGPLPAMLEQCVQRAMAKNPVERYQNGGEMLADLERVAVSIGRPGWRRWLP